MFGFSAVLWLFFPALAVEGGPPAPRRTATSWTQAQNEGGLSITDGTDKSSSRCEKDTGEAGWIRKYTCEEHGAIDEWTLMGSTSSAAD